MRTYSKDTSSDKTKDNILKDVNKFRVMLYEYDKKVPL